MDSVIENLSDYFKDYDSLDSFSVEFINRKKKMLIQEDNN